MKPASPFPVVVSVLAVVAAIALPLAWYWGGTYVNTLVATAGLGTHGTYTPTNEECHTTHDKHGSHESCTWHGIFAPHGYRNPDGAFEAAAWTSDGTQHEAWTAHVVPWSGRAVVPDTTRSHVIALVPAVIIIGFLVVTGLTVRVALRNTRAGRAARSKKRAGSTPPNPPDDGDVPGLTRY
ncbi:hypothetical protein [Luteimicrobium subarcticum]|uniref:Uncharacterized protein n=1 Tax=Luteimicrobium subarcticum TaxID=620910 RepID=A0A2M8W756_9MICO|nr:hypothetical protein [Luteimicrobium subarcticum]PJI86758.1 hypothetical protein CLV34_2681 [Luteimicrobium subarcticum]